jgi:hypothetical protein
MIGYCLSIEAAQVSQHALMNDIMITTAVRISFTSILIEDQVGLFNFIEKCS